jgi:hypothetical protein
MQFYRDHADAKIAAILCNTFFRKDQVAAGRGFPVPSLIGPRTSLLGGRNFPALEGRTRAFPRP